MKDPHKYSGDVSKPFWNRVKALALVSGKDHDELFRLGCLLQNLEGYVIDRLEEMERKK